MFKNTEFIKALRQVGITDEYVREKLRVIIEKGEAENVTREAIRNAKKARKILKEWRND